MDAPTTHIEVRDADTRWHSVQADGLEELPDSYPKPLRDAHARLVALADRVRATGTPYRADRIRLVAILRPDTTLGRWPATVPVPPLWTKTVTCLRRCTSAWPISTGQQPPRRSPTYLASPHSRTANGQSCTPPTTTTSAWPGATCSPTSSSPHARATRTRTQEIVDAPFEGIKSGQDLNAGKCDVAAAGMTITDARKQVLDFSDPYFDATQALLVATGTSHQSLAELNGKMVGVQAATTGEDGGVLVESGPPADVLGAPREARTREFVHRALQPTRVSEEEIEAHHPA